MSNWQQGIVELIIVLCLARILWGMFRFFVRIGKKENLCENCVSGCELKEQLERKTKECKKNRSSQKKKCCR